MGLMSTGCGLGMDALGSPIIAHASVPPFITISHLAPKKAGFQNTKSAIFPTSTDPILWLIPCATAGLHVYLARKRRTRKLSVGVVAAVAGGTADDTAPPPPPPPPAATPCVERLCFARNASSAAASSGSCPRCFFILSAVCQQRVMVSPILPMACESDDMMEIAPRSCNTSSAAMVCPRILDSAKEMSSGMALDKWWHTMSMSRCSSSVFTVYGLVGLVEEGTTLGTPHTVMMSGAWPPPAPSEWYVWMVRPLNAATERSTQLDSLSVSVWIVTCTSCSSATLRHASMAAGVVPQSSCSFRPTAPAATTSTNP
mmetsp:Transcript_59682/g.119798  ORF Transcript_59682/g.119798 Transcript_59682/m.119798 type:complete len:314 (-) Transcript_59682:547-1488(-)